MPSQERDKWRGARTTGQIRFETGTKSTNSTNPDSIYKPVNRKQFNFRPFTVPKQLQKELPYKDKPKFTPKQDDKITRVSAIKSDIEKSRLEALMMMSTLKKDRMLKMIEKKFNDKDKKEKMIKLKEKRKKLIKTLR
jgi:ribosome biogenesis protein BMS1